MSPPKKSTEPSIRAMLISGLFKSLDEAAVLIERLLFASNPERYAAAARAKAEKAFAAWDAEQPPRRGRPLEYPRHIVEHARRMRQREPRPGFVLIARELEKFYGMDELSPDTVRKWCEPSRRRKGGAEPGDD